MTMTRITTEAEATKLGHALLQKGRRRPAVVVSVAQAQGTAYIDIGELDRAVGDYCDVYEITTGPLTYALSDVLPPGREVYGGASRVYAVDNAWVADQYTSPLRFAFAPDKDERILGILIEDAMTAAHAAGLGPGQRTGSTRVRVSGTVMGAVAGTALVDIGKMLPATAYPDVLVPGLDAERLFVKGQEVSGLWSSEANTLEVEGMLAPVEALAGVAPKDVLLARVSKVGSKDVTLELHPRHLIVVRPPEEEGDPRQSYTPGEVVPVEVNSLGEDGLPAQVLVLPLEYAELARPVALLTGGPGWLEAAAPVSEEPEDDGPAVLKEGGLARTSGGGGQELEGLRDEVVRLEARVRTLTDQLATARTRARADKLELGRLRRELSAASDQRTVASPGLFADERDQFVHEAYVSWAERTTPADKVDHPWREPVVGDDFLATLGEVQGISRAKIVEVVADVVTGRADSMAAREIHQLRSGPGGDDPPRTRAGGETCWRASLQQGTPSARRLHYWRLSDGGVELSSVRLHDDFRA